MTRAQLCHFQLAAFAQPRLRIVNPIGQRRATERLRLEEDAAQLALLETALGLQGGEQPLVMQMPVTEVPAEREPGNDFAVEVFVVAEIRYRAHTLTGSCRNVGASAMGELCAAIEHGSSTDPLSDVGRLESLLEPTLAAARRVIGSG